MYLEDVPNPAPGSCLLFVLQLRSPVRMDQLLELGLGCQDVGCVSLLFILAVYFPANTCLAAALLSQGG